MKIIFVIRAVVAALILGSFLTQAAPIQTNYLRIPATEAKKHIGEIATVYGKLYRVWLDTGRYVGVPNRVRYETPIHLDVGGYDTNRILGITLMDGDNATFLRLKKAEGKEISVAGKIGTNLPNGIPEIAISFIGRISVTRQTEQLAPSFPDSNTNLEKPASPDVGKTTNFIILTWTDTDATNTIVTILGKVYHRAKVTFVEPDGLTIKYTPDGGGFGGVKIPFENLPLKYQQQYGYDSQQAAAYLKAKEEQRKQTEAKQVQLDAEQIKADYQQAEAEYELAKEAFDAGIKIQTLQAQQQIADAQTQAAQAAALQARILQGAEIERQIQQQQQLWEMQDQTYQQQRIADQINDLNWQLRRLYLYR